MFNISDYLAKFKVLAPPKKHIKEAVRRALFSLYDIDVADTSIDIRDDVVYLSVEPVFKNELFLHKEQVLHAVQKELGAHGERVKDIR